MMSNCIVEVQHLQCEQVEIWDHVINCKEPIILRREFTKYLLVVLVKNKPVDLNVNAIISFTEVVMQCPENEEEVGKINQ